MPCKRFFVYVIALSLCVGLSACAHKNASYRTEAHFSSDGHVRSEIIRTIENSKTSIDIAIFDFTSKDIKESLGKAKNRDVKIRIIADARQASGAHSVVQSLLDEGFSVKTVHGRSGGIMHHKFAIFDGDLLLTGSYNWTDNAEHHNFENAIFLTDPNTIKRYQEEFNTIWINAS